MLMPNAHGEETVAALEWDCQGLTIVDTGRHITLRTDAWWVDFVSSFSMLMNALKKVFDVLRSKQMLGLTNI